MLESHRTGQSRIGGGRNIVISQFTKMENKMNIEASIIKYRSKQIILLATLYY